MTARIELDNEGRGRILPPSDSLMQLEVLLASQRIFAESVVESLRNLRAEVATLHDELAEMRDEALALARRVGVEPVATPSRYGFGPNPESSDVPRPRRLRGLDYPDAYRAWSRKVGR